MTEFGWVVEPSVILNPGSRYTARVNDTVSSYNVSTKVSATQPVVVERAVFYGVATQQ